MLCKVGAGVTTDVRDEAGERQGACGDDSRACVEEEGLEVHSDHKLASLEEIMM